MSVNNPAQAVAVIGASGFVGRHIVQRLAMTAGLRPIALARRPAPAGSDSVEWRRCDAADPASVAAAVAGCSHAVNCVAGDAPTMLAATRNLCAAASAAGLGRVVHLSSMAVYGDAAGLVEEGRRLSAAPGWYGQSKRACEAVMAGFTAAGGEGVILRPGCVHGPHSEPWTARIGRLLRQRRIGDLGPAGDGLCNLVYIDDVAGAVLAALQQPRLAGGAFNVADPDPGTWNAYFVAFARAIGATPVRRIAGRWLTAEATLLAAPLKLAHSVAARAGFARLAPDPLPRSLLRLWQQDIQLDHQRADASLGFARTPPHRAIAEAARWFRALG